MSSKKYLLIICIMLLTSAAFAQSQPGRYSIWDSSVITPRNMPQQNEFWNNTYDYPAKPRNMWEVGVSGGLFNVKGDVSSVTPTFGFAAHVRKSFGYVFSMRLQYLNGTAKGMNWQGTRNYFGDNNQWIRAGYGTNDEVVYHNYKNNTQDLSLQGIISLNNLRFHRHESNFLFYAGAGIGATAYETMIDALDANGNRYTTLFNSTYNQRNDPNSNLQATYKNRKDIRDALKDGMDGDYETAAQSKGEKTSQIGGKTLRFSTTVLAGMSYRLSKRINLSLENRHTFIKDDLLDGQQYQDVSVPVLTSNWDSYNYLSLGLNFNLGKNSVEPLYWINPLNYAYSELNNPKHMKLPKPTFDDADGDGVIDQLDREPNTPAGCPVDTHGVSRDTDGDGVPDCLDKQLVTPTECQPVDASGVGKCPDPECCKNIKETITVNCPCDYPSLSFSGSTVTLSASAKSMLTVVAATLKANPGCNITLTGYPEASKASQANCQSRVSAARMHLIEKEGISADRITTNCEVGGGDRNTLDIKCQ